MSSPGTRYVVDASVAIKLIVEEPLTDRARALFSLFESDPASEAYVPDLFYVECANTLWKCVRRFRISETVALEGIEKLQSLILTQVSTSHVLREALRLAIEHGISAYDATYVASALLVRAPLVTCDEPLAEKFAGKQPSVALLANLPLASGQTAEAENN